MSTLAPNDAPVPAPRGAGPASGRAACEGARSGVRPDKLTSTFRPLFVVGRGGMGSVEVALETREGGEENVVALKRMLPNAVVDKRQVEMFLREATLAHLLVHPNVVRATSFGENDGELLLVMEYIEGESLSSVVARAHDRDGGLALPFIAHILAEICEGLHAAHELKDETGRPLNVVHRDVSPHNVMVAYEGLVKLLDFGVAKIEAIGADGRTKTGEVKGKTAYMSPEQAMGDAIDRRSDLYSLGAVLFEAVSGRKMWGGGTDLDVIRRLALEEPPSLEEAAPGTPPSICQLQRRLVARDPDMRPKTALEVAGALRAFVTSTGTVPKARDMRALMARLFAEEIEKRRATLRTARVEVERGSTSAPAEAHALPAAADATPSPATRVAAPVVRSRWSRGVIVGLTGLALAALAGGALWPRGEASRAKAASTTSVSTASDSAPVAGQSKPMAAPSASPPSSSESATSAEPEPSRVPAGKPAAARPSGAPRAITKPHPAGPPSKPSPPLDVDPTPF
jgi:hypothetical protein